MKINTEWKDYQIIATGNGEKLERWKDVYLLRPDPQAIWKSQSNLSKYPKLNAKYIRSETGGGHWEYLKQMPDSWVVSWRGLKFRVKPMGFKHTGLFPEQAVNWSNMIRLIESVNRPISVLNLFAYTGGATVACLSAGASVCHVDAAKNMVERAKENVSLSGLSFDKARFIVDDCIILDPPSYGRGASGEIWKIENDLYDFVDLCTKVLSDNPLFVLINSYTTGLQPAVLNNILKMTMKGFKGSIDS